MEASEHNRSAGASKQQFLAVRWLVAVGVMLISMGILLFIHAPNSLFASRYLIAAPILVVVGVGTLARIPQQRRAIREAEDRDATRKV
jgi:hypothetical protein